MDNQLISKLNGLINTLDIGDETHASVDIENLNVDDDLMGDIRRYIKSKSNYKVGFFIFNSDDKSIITGIRVDK